MVTSFNTHPTAATVAAIKRWLSKSRSVHCCCIAGKCPTPVHAHKRDSSSSGRRLHANLWQQGSLPNIKLCDWLEILDGQEPPDGHVQSFTCTRLMLTRRPSSSSQLLCEYQRKCLCVRKQETESDEGPVLKARRRLGTWPSAAWGACSPA